jgi:hypothetical protein
VITKILQRHKNVTTVTLNSQTLASLEMGSQVDEPMCFTHVTSFWTNSSLSVAKELQVLHVLLVLVAFLITLTGEFEHVKCFLELARERSEISRGYSAPWTLIARGPFLARLAHKLAAVLTTTLSSILDYVSTEWAY